MSANAPTTNPFSQLPSLSGSSLGLRQLQPGDFEALFAAASDPLIWAQHPEPTRYQREVFQRFFDSALAGGSTYVVIDKASGKIIGSSRYYEWNPQKQEVAIGYTFIARSHWGGSANGELKRLMLAHAFKHANTVWFHVGKGNLRSRKALEKIAARFSHEEKKEMFGQIHEYVFYRMDSPALLADRHALWQEGVKLHQQGELARAKAIYQQVLAADPQHFDALHLLGVIEHQGKNHALAVDMIDRAIAINPAHPSAHSNRGLALKELGQWQAAVESHDNAIRLNPNFSQAHCNRGNALRELKRLDEAIESFDHAIRLKPDYSLAWYSKGLAHHSLQQTQQALESYDKALSLNMVSEQLLCNRGMALIDLKRWQEAQSSCERALQINPNNPLGYFNRGMALNGQKRQSEALADFDKAIELKPDFAEAWYNRGVVLKDMGRWNEAIQSYHEAVRLKPDNVQALTNLGNAYKELLRLPQAIEFYDKAIKTRADYTPALWNKSLAHLLMGDFKTGWALYEWRWNSEDGIFYKFKRQFAQPMWLGQEALSGKTILLHAEQGFGDTIQFCRYAKTLADMGARVVLEVPRPLMGLLGGLEGVSGIVMRGADLPEFDTHCPLMSLPLAFNTELQGIPSPEAYLSSDAKKRQHWQDRLGRKTKKRIGLVWSGSAAHTNDANRSISLAELIRHLPAGCEYVSLQKEIRASDLQTLTQCGIAHFEDEIFDFSDTAALCDLMDVVLSVDTSVAHLAGALGKPTWLLLPWVPDWRWLLNRDDSPWYASMRLYRQDADRQWEPVLKRVAGDLARVVD